MGVGIKWMRMKITFQFLLLFCCSSALAQTQKDSLVNAPSFVKEEEEIGEDYVLHRTIVNVNGALTTFERKEWNWGGVFFLKNGVVYPYIEGKEKPITTW